MNIFNVINYIQQKLPVFLIRLGVAVLIIGVAFWVAHLLSRLAERAFVHHSSTQTLGSIVRSIVRAAVIILGVITGLDHVGIDIRTILAGAGIIGLAIGFGAQTLVKDCISGFFLIAQRVMAVGDQVQIGTHKGKVERIGLRMTEIRAHDGELWYIPNGEIKEVGNFSREANSVIP